MAQEPVVIPEKIYFKIGEVCEILGVQAHVLRYWETEFAVLSPQKNKSGQRSYRRRDVEIALKIKQLLYNEMFTIAGARKKLQQDQRDGNNPKPPVDTVPAAPQPIRPVYTSSDRIEAPTLFDTSIEVPAAEISTVQSSGLMTSYNGDQRDAVKVLATHLLELHEMLRSKSAR